MANNSFTFTISAVDKATATVRKVNAAVDRLTAPFTRTATAFKGLGRELGFQKIGSDLKVIRHEAGGAARSIGAIVAPMAAITGLGTIAGIAALANNWAKLGRNVDNSARKIGLSTGELQKFQGAARLVGIEDETTTSSLDALATTMQDAQWGRNQGALLMLNKLGIGLKKTKDGANDVVGEYKAIADAIAKQANPQVQALIANSLGLGAMLPFLREGSKGITEYEAQVQRLGFVMDQQAIERSKGFARSLAGLDMALDGTKNAIGNELIPVFRPLVEEFTTWLVTNRKLIATDIAGWAKGFAAWIEKIDWTAVGHGLTDFAKGIEKTVDWLGGWENAAIAVVAVMNLGLIATAVSLGGSLLKAGTGILSFITLLKDWKTAAGAARAAQAALGGAAAVEGVAGTAAVAEGVLGAAGIAEGAAGAAGLAATLGGLGVAGATLAVGTAGALGYGTGYLANKYLIEGTSTGDWIGEKTAKGMAFLGSSTAKDAVMTNDLAKGVVPGGKDAAAKALQFFIGKGWTPAQAGGIVANLGVESSYDPHSYGDRGHAYGVAQWHYDRQQDFIKWAGKDIHGSSLEEQLAFVDYEMRQGKEIPAGRRLAGAKTAREAGEIVSRYYERPDDIEGDARRRAQLADALMAPSGPASIAKSVAAPAGPYSQGAAKAEDSKIHVEVELKNAPEGTKAKVKSEGPAQASSRVGYSGVGALV